MYRDMIKPRHKQLFDAQKKAFPSPFFIWFHSDGAVYDILPDFIEIGVEVLNPLQLTARGMDAAQVKTEFGKDLTFWGAGVNTQQILPRGTPDHVRQDVQSRIEILSPDSGFVFGTVHNIQDDVPLENILAMLETFEQMRYNTP
jgi:uroporphyrinogen decarboxylase